jgi:hypothetical protein
MIHKSALLLETYSHGTSQPLRATECRSGELTLSRPDGASVNRLAGKLAASKHVSDQDKDPGHPLSLVAAADDVLLVLRLC